MTYSDVEFVRETTADEGRVIMPFYLLVDVSGSMSRDAGELNGAVAELIRTIVKDPVVDDLVMLSIITFNHMANTIVPLSSPSEIIPPTLQPSGGTNYGAAFHEFVRVFESDRADLRSQGMKVYRPCVFFLTDGGPGDHDYYETFRGLFAYDPESRIGNKAFPYFSPIGFREAPVEVLQRLAYPDFGRTRGRWFLSRSNDVGEILRTVAEVIGRTVVSSGMSVTVGAPAIIAPEVPAGSDMQFGDAGDFVD